MPTVPFWTMTITVTPSNSALPIYQVGLKEENDVTLAGSSSSITSWWFLEG
jgi:hypothetical protein